MVGWIDGTTLGPTTTTGTGIKRITVTVTRGPTTMGQVAAYRTQGWSDTIPAPTDAPGNHPPVASAAASMLNPKAGTDTVTFDGSGSSDQDGDTLSYVWAFGDGATASGVTASHVFAAKQTYNVTLTVYDGHGGVGIGTVTVTAK